MNKMMSDQQRKNPLELTKTFTLWTISVLEAPERSGIFMKMLLDFQIKIRFCVTLYIFVLFVSSLKCTLILAEIVGVLKPYKDLKPILFLITL